MPATVKSLGIDKLALDERVALVEEIWDSIASEASGPPLTDTQRAKLDQRILEDDANLGDVVPWEEVKAATLARLAE